MTSDSEVNLSALNHSTTLSTLISAEEAALRRGKVLALLDRLLPEADGLLVTGKANVFYLSGTMASGLFWLPREGAPILFVRKGEERARAESPIERIASFKSFRQIAQIAEELESPLGHALAVDKENFSWSMADMLLKRMGSIRFLSGDDVLVRARSVKTAYEAACMKECGQIHAHVLDNTLPGRLKVGLTEREAALLYVEEALRAGSEGLCRLTHANDEMFFGYASIAENGLYPTSFPGPLGCRGVSPATPFLGAPERIWKKDEVLSVDMACSKFGYLTDRTQVYFSGSRLPDIVARAQDCCEEILDKCIEITRPGNSPAEIWAASLGIAKNRGFAEGYMGLGPDQLAFLGHGVGLCLDEWPALAKSFTEPLETGMTLALEPKISLEGIGMVGVEHTYLVGEKETVSLTGTRTGILCLGE